VTGLKTAFGRVPVKGVYPLAPSLDTVGPLGRDIAAVALGMRLLEPGFRVPAEPPPLIAARPAVTGLSGVRGGAGDGEVDPSVDAVVDRALAAAGVGVTRVPGWDFGQVLEAVGILIDGEGFRSNAYLMPYERQLSPHVRRNLERGARLTRADRAAAERVRAALGETMNALLRDFPVLVLPTLAGQPPLLGERSYPLTALTAPASLAGLPALSLPVPAPDGFLASLQLIGRTEEQVLAFGAKIEAGISG
jgi:amidase